MNTRSTIFAASASGVPVLERGERWDFFKPTVYAQLTGDDPARDDDYCFTKMHELRIGT